MFILDLKEMRQEVNNSKLSEYNNKSQLTIKKYKGEMKEWK